MLPLLAHLAWEWLQIDTDLLLIITSTADELSSGTNIDDLERPWTSKIRGFSDFFVILGCDMHLKSELLEIDEDNLLSLTFALRDCISAH